MHMTTQLLTSDLIPQFVPFVGSVCVIDTLRQAEMSVQHAWNLVLVAQRLLCTEVFGSGPLLLC